MNSTKFLWKSVLAYLLAAFFLVGAMGNIFASDEIAADYARWGYPAWFHYLTGLSELIASALLMIKSLRFWGAALGAGVMIGAAVTVMLHGELTHAIAPLVVLAIALVVGWLNKIKTKV